MCTERAHTPYLPVYISAPNLLVIGPPNCVYSTCLEYLHLARPEVLHVHFSSITTRERPPEIAPHICGRHFRTSGRPTRYTAYYLGYKFCRQQKTKNRLPKHLHPIEDISKGIFPSNALPNPNKFLAHETSLSEHPPESRERIHRNAVFV